MGETAGGIFVANAPLGAHTVFHVIWYCLHHTFDKIHMWKPFVQRKSPWTKKKKKNRPRGERNNLCLCRREKKTFLKVTEVLG